MESKPRDYSCEGCKHLKKDYSAYPSLICMLGNPLNSTRCEEYDDGENPDITEAEIMRRILTFNKRMDDLAIRPKPKPGELIRALVQNKMLT